jgi:hypothetical protein
LLARRAGQKTARSKEAPSYAAPGR